MSNLNPTAFPPLWRVMGLSVVAGFAGLGSYIAAFPIQASNTLDLRAPDNSKQNDKYLSTACAWIGARDISFAVAMAVFYHQGKPKELGTLILSSAVLCATDIYCVFRARGGIFAGLLGIGASIWMCIGYNLIKL